MLSFVTRRFAIITVLLAAFTLAGCGDKEPQQRKAFMDFMETRMLASKTVSIPKLSDQDKEAFGPYVAHYQVLADFHDGLNKSMSDRRNLSSMSAKFQSLKGLQENWKEINNLRDLLKPLLVNADISLEKAKASRASLKQSDDLKNVYDRVFDKVVIQQYELVKKFVPATLRSFDTMEAMGRFMDENKKNIDVSGSMVQITDESLHKQMQILQNNYLAATQELVPIVQSMRQMFGR